MSTRNLLRAAGLLVWVCAGIPAVLNIARDPFCIAPGFIGLPIWIAAFAVFGVTFFYATRAGGPHGTHAIGPIAVQTLTALGMNTLFCTGFEVALLLVVAVQLGWMLPARIGVPWLVAQSVAAATLAVYHMGWEDGSSWAFATLAVEVFAFIVAAMAGRETAARRELERTNGILEATRESLARASRDAERIRIARELHDLLGHDLVALHLELEVAGHLAQGKAKEPISRAHDVARRLLEDVRNTVSTLREDPNPTDVARSIRAIVGRVRTPRIDLDAPESLVVDDEERANAVVRSTQEIVTNAVKHARAQNLWIAITVQNGRLELTARDDGAGSADVEPGNGLSGMRERFERLGGMLALETAKGEGFRVRAALPLSREPS